MSRLVAVPRLPRWVICTRCLDRTLPDSFPRRCECCDGDSSWLVGVTENGPHHRLLVGLARDARVVRRRFELSGRNRGARGSAAESALPAANRDGSPPR